MCPVYFMIEGPKGDQAYKDAEKIAKEINNYVEEINGKERS